jgi:hypothetical protein
MANNPDYIGLGLSFADACQALNWEINGKKADELSRSVYDAINHLTS